MDVDDGATQGDPRRKVVSLLASGHLSGVGALVDAYTDLRLKLLEKTGDIVFKDDEADFPRFSFEGHPSPFHHWQVGIAMQWGAYLLRTALNLQEAMDILRSGASASAADVDAALAAMLWRS